MKRFGLVFGVLLAWLEPAVGCAADESLVEIKSKVSWSTELQPELHVLIQNRTSQTVEFSVAFGSSPESRCNDLLGEAAVGLSVALGRFKWFYYAKSIGTIPPNGWAHRSIPYGPMVLRSACSIPFTVESRIRGSDAQRFEGSFEVPVFPPRVGDATGVVDGWGSASAFVERRGLPGHVLVRTLIRNLDGEARAVAVTNRELRCEGGSRALWGLRNALLHRDSVGPLWLEANGWSVFVSDVEVEGSGCTGTIEVSTSPGIEEDYKSPISVEFKLDPEGWYGHGSLKGRPQVPWKVRDGATSRVRD